VLHSTTMFRAIILAALLMIFLNIPEGGETGPIIEFISRRAELGESALLVAFGLTFVRPWIGALVCICGVLLATPLLAFQTIPRLFQRIYPGNYSIAPQHFFNFDWLSILMLISLLLLTILSVVVLFGAARIGLRTDTP